MVSPIDVSRMRKLSLAECLEDEDRFWWPLVSQQPGTATLDAMATLQRREQRLTIIEPLRCGDAAQHHLLHHSLQLYPVCNQLDCVTEHVQSLGP